MMPDVKIKGWSGTEFSYQNVPKIWLNAPESTEESPVLVPYTYGEAVSKTVEPDFSAGDMAVDIPEGELVTGLTITKPETLIPENIVHGVTIAGVTGVVPPLVGVSGLKYMIPVRATLSRYGSGNQIQLGSGNVYIKQNSTLQSREDVHAILYPKMDTKEYGMRRLGMLSLASFHDRGVHTNGYIYWGATFTLDSTGSSFNIETSTKGMFASQNLGGQASVKIDTISNAFSKVDVSNYLTSWEGFILVYDYYYEGSPKMLSENNYIIGAGLTVIK